MDQRGDAARPGRIESFGEELEACRGHLTRMAERMIPPSLRPKIGASDLVQETFVDAQRRLGDLKARGRAELCAWLYRVMVLNLAEQKRTYLATARADVRREVRDDAAVGEGRPPLIESIPDDRPTPATAAMSRERLARLASAMGDLEERDRRAILLRYAEGLGFAEIGRRLDGLSEDGARKLYGRACRRLLDRFEGASP